MGSETTKEHVIEEENLKILAECALNEFKKLTGMEPVQQVVFDPALKGWCVEHSKEGYYYSHSDVVFTLDAILSMIKILRSFKKPFEWTIYRYWTWPSGAIKITKDPTTTYFCESKKLSSGFTGDNSAIEWRFVGFS